MDFTEEEKAILMKFLKVATEWLEAQTTKTDAEIMQRLQRMG